VHKKSQVEKIYREFLWIFTVQHRKQFQDSNIPKSYLTQIRGFSWHNNKIKRIRRGYYNSFNFQDSNKRKELNIKTLGYLPRVLFFNAFELGTESCESSIFKRSIKINCRSFVNKELYFIHISFWRPFVITLWFTQITKKIFGTNSIKIIFKSFIQSQKLAR
jgi:hypothetical protein